MEEKEFLILCRELAIAEQLNNYVTSAALSVNSIELKGFSIRNFADEKYGGGNCIKIKTRTIYTRGSRPM